MFETEEKIRKCIITPDGEDEFQIRFDLDEKVGLLTARSGKSFLILDSIDYWYDIIQEKYPQKRKCKCKNDFFKLYFDFIPRADTDDYRAVELISRCTECGNQRTFAAVDIDYSPTEQLFEQPITYCEKPKIKYKTYYLSGYWKEDAFHDIVEFMSQQQLMIYFWYVWQGECIIEKVTADKLLKLMFEEKVRYLHIYFTAEPIEEAIFYSEVYERYFIEDDVWRKKEAISMSSPAIVAGYGLCYAMEFCSEYIEKGEVKSKSEEFCKLVQKVLEYCKKRLK